MVTKVTATLAERGLHLRRCETSSPSSSFAASKLVRRVFATLAAGAMILHRSESAAYLCTTSSVRGGRNGSREERPVSLYHACSALDIGEVGA